MVVRPQQFTWKEEELRLAASSISSGGDSACPERCGAQLDGFYKATGALWRLHKTPAPLLRRLESLLLPPPNLPSSAAQACDGRKELMEVLA
jgi:hypothetical protein